MYYMFLKYDINIHCKKDMGTGMYTRLVSSDHIFRALWG